LSFGAHIYRTPANIRTNLIVLETTIIDLHVPLTVWVYMYLHSNFSDGLHKTIFFCKSAFRPFKVMQGHWFWYQSKARMRLPIGPS